VLTSHFAYPGYSLVSSFFYNHKRERNNLVVQKGLKRKLTAILSADVEGYSRLMGDDEESTIRTLTNYRSAMTALIQKHRGRVVDAPGDNLLAEFSSAVYAVTGAVEIQRELAERNNKLSDERKMHFRIGVNVGDVVEEEDRIYGDGVNIAARIQEAAESNSVFVSQSLFEQVKRQSVYRFEDLGLHSLKNISEQIRLYKVIGDMPTHRFSNSPSKKHPSAVGVRKASIAVLPFEVTGGDENQQYFADGLRVRLAESWVLNTFSKGKSDALGIKCGSQYVS